MKHLIAVACLLFAAALHAAPIPPPPRPDPLGMAFLGVQQEAAAVDVVIGEIIPQSGAATAGLKEGDKILKVGNTEVSNFTHLQQLIRMYRPGAIIPIRIERDGKEQTVKAQLGERKQEKEEE